MITFKEKIAVRRKPETSMVGTRCNLHAGKETQQRQAQEVYGQKKMAGWWSAYRTQVVVATAWIL